MYIYLRETVSIQYVKVSTDTPMFSSERTPVKMLSQMITIAIPLLQTTVVVLRDTNKCCGSFS